MNIEKHLPLTETAAYIMLALNEPLYGYAVMQVVLELSQNTVTLGAGTLYTSFTKLERHGLIEKAGEDGRRKLYQLTDFGRKVLTEHHRRAAIFVASAAPIVDPPHTEVVA